MRLFLAAALAAATVAHAGPPRSLFLEELTWTEFRDAVAGGTNVVLVPIGGTEQNGPHIALGKHNARARELARRVAERLGNAVVAPVVAYVPEGSIDPPAGHMRFPGTLTVPEDAFERTLESAARSLLRHGVRHVVLLGDHGGYRRSLERVSRRVKGVHFVPEYYRELPHAGREDTSLALAIDPALVRDDGLAAARGGEQGVQASPAGANRDEGAELARNTVERTAAAIGKIVSGR